jgi:hypothetical protein
MPVEMQIKYPTPDDFPWLDRSGLMLDAHRIIANQIEASVDHWGCLSNMNPQSIVPLMLNFDKTRCGGTACLMLAIDVLNVWRNVNKISPLVNATSHFQSFR